MYSHRKFAVLLLKIENVNNEPSVCAVEGLKLAVDFIFRLKYL